MGVVTQPRPARTHHGAKPRLYLVAARRSPTGLHLLTYTVGTALFWVLWAAISISADTWYWWAIVPVAGWTLVLALHLTRAYDRSP